MFWAILVLVALSLCLQVVCVVMLITVANGLLRVLSRMEEPPAPVPPIRPDSGLVDPDPRPSYDPRFSQPVGPPT